MNDFHYLEVMLAKQLGAQLQRWKVKKEHPFHGNARCPVCGDSATSKTKARFHIIERDSKLFVHCFNCDLSTNFITFLKGHYPPLYNEYIFGRYKSSNSSPVIKTTLDETTLIPKKQSLKTTLDLELVSSLSDSDPIKKYVASRKLPEYPFQVAPEFFKLVNKYNPDVAYKPGQKDEMRLVIPFFDREGNVHAFQGRDMSGKSNQKYITVIVNHKIPKIFGICQVDFKQHINVVEGPLDSLFLPNCIASVNASLSTTADRLCSINKNLKDHMTLIFDNEPRNASVLKHYEKAIDNGYSVVIWPQSIKQKDINDMVLSGLDPLKIIQRNTYRGLSAKLEFLKWRRC